MSSRLNPADSLNCDRVGGSLLAPPSHTTVRTVPYTAVLLEERDQPELFEEGPSEGVVHVAGPGVPPGTVSIVGGRRCPSRVETPLHQALRAGARPFPLPPQDAAQLAPQPAVEFLEDPFCLRQPEVLDPAAQ